MTPNAPLGPTEAEQDGDLEDHVTESVAAIAKVHHDHLEQASGLERQIDRLNSVIARPGFAIALLAALTLGIAAAFAGASSWREPPETALFAWLELAATISALIIAVMILSTQRRQEALTEKRAELTLELALLSERKTGKIIDLIEELRRDTPSVGDRSDPEARAMAKSLDPDEVLNAIQDERPDGTRK